MLTVLFLICLSSASIAQSTDKVRLQWKIADDETLVYTTQMNEIDTASITMNFGSLFDSLAGSMAPESKKLFDKILASYQAVEYESLLNSEDTVVSIQMKTVKKEPEKKKKTKKDEDEDIDVQRLLSTLSNDIVLRGSVYKSGGIASFWVKTQQKNLIAIFFELPKKEISVGDTWELEVSLISNDQNFVCDSAYRKNQVSLIGLEVNEGDTVALLKYDIAEFVTGDFDSPFSDNPKRTTMFITHEAIARFSLARGRWTE